MREDYCREAASQILELEKGTILLTTGFYVAGHAETDGPLGTLVMADALQKLGYHPVIVTDEFCRGFFENEDLEVYYAGVNDEAQEYDRMLETYRPVGLISIERCGRNVEDDYANMRGISIKEYTASTDWLFIPVSYTHLIFAVFAGFASFGIGCATQVNAIANVVEENTGVQGWIVGLVVAILTAIVIFGGIKSIATVCEKLVPFMAIFYVIGCLIILGINYDYILPAIQTICKLAFTPGAAAGGLVGTGIRLAMQYGICLLYTSRCV